MLDKISTPLLYQMHDLHFVIFSLDQKIKYLAIQIFNKFRILALFELNQSNPYPFTV